jgi:hypothetical protein
MAREAGQLISRVDDARDSFASRLAAIRKREPAVPQQTIRSSFREAQS